MADHTLKPRWLLTYSGRDITADIVPFVTRVEYTDHAHGESDEIAIDLEDKDGRWINSWYPSKRDQVTLYIGYDGQPLLPCGDFEIDDVEWSSPPDMVKIRGLGAGISPALRTETSRAYEGTTLRGVAERIADAHGLTVTGTITDIRIARITQDRRRDLEFLSSLAKEYDHVFSVRGGRLVFHRVADLDAAEASVTLDRTDMTRVNIRDKAREIYAGAEGQYHNPATRELLAHEVAAKHASTGDTLKVMVRAENQEQAELKTKAALAQANRGEAAGTIDRIGDPRLAAGANVTLTGCGRWNGKWAIERSRHAIDRKEGYRTSIEIRGITP
jgi:phage protein D